MSKFHMAHRMEKVRMGLLGNCNQETRDKKLAPFWPIDLSQRHQTCSFNQNDPSLCRSCLILFWDTKTSQRDSFSLLEIGVTIKPTKYTHKNYIPILHTNPVIWFMFLRGHRSFFTKFVNHFAWNLCRWIGFWLRSSNEINYQTEKQGILGGQLEKNFGVENPWESRAGNPCATCSTRICCIHIFNYWRLLQNWCNCSKICRKFQAVAWNIPVG